MPPPPEGARPSLRGIVEGVRYARSRPELLGTYGVDFVAMFFGMPMALYPAFAAEFGGPEVLGLLYAAPSAGALVATLTSDSRGAEAFETADVVSTGEEFEAVLNPTKNWRIAFNANRAKAVRSRVALNLRAVFEQAVFDAFHLPLAGPRAQDLEIGIDLRAVGVDDHAVRALGQCHPKGRLAAGGRAGDDQHGWGARIRTWDHGTKTPCLRGPAEKDL